MEKKDYTKPAIWVEQLQPEHQVLAGSYADITIVNPDDNVPVYDPSSSVIWEAN